MRTVEGEVFPTFGNTCLQQGLLPNDAECKGAFRDAFESPFHPMTELFAMVFAHYEPAEPRRIFADFWIMFITDIRNMSRSQPPLSDPNLVIQCVLAEIQDALSKMFRTSMSQFNLQTSHNLRPHITLSQQQTPERL